MTSPKLLCAVVVGSLTLVACAKSGSSPESETAVAATEEPVSSGTADTVDPSTANATGLGADPALEPGPIGATGPGGEAAPALASAPPATPLTDGQIAYLTEAVDKGEIEQAKEVQKKAKNPQVKKLAAQLIQHHTKSKQKGQTLVKKAQLTPEDSAVASELTAKAEENLQAIRAAGIPAEAERAYVDAQVRQHEQVLELLNTRLIPNATNAELKARLEETRKLVESHIEESRRVQQAISETPTATPPAG